MSRAFIIKCQKARSTGGFSKLVGHHADPLHSYYSICGLSFAGEEGLRALDVRLGVSKRAAEAARLI